MVYVFEGSHMGSHVGFWFLVSLYHWLCSSFVFVGDLWFDEWFIGLRVVIWVVMWVLGFW